MKRLVLMGIVAYGLHACNEAQINPIDNRAKKESSFGEHVTTNLVDRSNSPDSLTYEWQQGI